MNTSGVLSAFDAATGSRNWTRQLQQVSFDGPTALNGIVYATGGNSGAAEYAVRESDGSILWTQSSIYGGAPAVTAQGVYVSGQCAEAYDLDPGLGTLLWHNQGFCLSSSGGDTPAVAGGHVLVFGLSLSATTGWPDGSFGQATSYPYAIPAVANGVAFVVSGPSGGTALSAVDGTGLGSTEWTFTGNASLSTAPIVAGGLVFVGSSSGDLYALDKQTGATTWSTSVGAYAVSGVAAANGTVVVSAAGHLVAYAPSGTLANTPTNQSPPTVDGSTDLNELKAADVGIWSGLPSAYAYQWELCDAAGASCADIPGATGPSYVPGADAYGSTIRVRVVASNGSGSSDPVESALSDVLGLTTTPPAFSTAPVVSGSPTVGQQLTTSNGVWAHSATSYAYQWQRCDYSGANCVDIAGANVAQYTPVADDVGNELRSEVLASNAVGPAPGGYEPSAATDPIAAAGAPTIPTPPSDQATALQMDPAHDGSIAETGLTAPLTKAWSILLPAGDAASYPLIANGMVFVASQPEMKTLSQYRLYAFNQATGAMVWSQPIGDLADGLTYDRGRVFVADDSGGVSAFDAATGSAVWSAQLGENGAPTAANGILYLGTGGVRALSEDANQFPVGVVGSMTPQLATAIPVQDGTASAVSKGDRVSVDTGETQQTFTASADAPIGAEAIPITTANVSADLSGGIITDLSSFLWKQPVPDGEWTSPAVTAQGVFATYDCQQMYGFDPQLGTLLWHPPGRGEGGGGENPVAASGHVYVRDSCLGNVVLSSDTGAVQGSFNAGPPPAVANGVAYMLSGSTLSAIGEAGLGDTNWSFTGDGTLATAPIVAGGLVFIGSDGTASSSGKLYALDAATGTTVWSTDAATPVARAEQSLAASNGTLIETAGREVSAYRSVGAIVHAPSNDSQPTIAGPADLSGLEAADVGIWSGLPSSYSYQWERCDGQGANCADIAAATAPTYKPPAADVGIGATLRVRIVATNGVGSSAAVESAPSTNSPVLSVARSSAAPRRDAADGQVYIGQEVSTSKGIWTHDPTSYLFKWQRCNLRGLRCVDIPGATNLQYTVVSADVGHDLRSEVRARNAVGPAATYAPSGPSTPVSGLRAPALSSSPIVSGSPAVGSQLHTTAGAWTNYPTNYAYQWQRCTSTGSSCANIPKATKATYTLTAVDAGHAIRSEVLASNPAGAAASGYAPSSPTGVVGYKPAVTTLPKLSGNAKVGKSLSVTTGTWKNAPTAYAYQWLRCDSSGLSCKKIGGATHSSYRLTATDVGHKLKGQVTASNAAGSMTATSSNTSAAVKK